MIRFKDNECEHSETTCAYVLEALAPAEIAGAKAHIASCTDCRDEAHALKRVADRMASWPTAVLRAPASLKDRLRARIGDGAGKPAYRSAPPAWPEPEWEGVAPGIACKLLATDRDRRRVSMLVRLAPGARYPAHTHAGVEELHLLEGELWIDARKLVPGDYNLGAPGAGDDLVWSETGCTCVLVTSTDDILR